jgi:uncharacterized Zn finger protein
MAAVKRRARFDVDKLRELAGDKSFARGEAYFREDRVTVISIETARVLAQVSGTEDYRTELRGRGKRIGGNCSCPAFEDRGFCKHLAAAALAANAAGEDGVAAGTGVLDRIRRHLKGKPVDALVEIIIEVAEENPHLLRKLDLATAAADGDATTIEKRLRSAIDAATRTRGFVDYMEARKWAANVEAALDTLASLAKGGHAKIVLLLADHAIDRIGRAAENIDDSDGRCGALMARARDIHLAAAVAVRPDPVRLAQDLFARETGGGFETFHGAAGLYAKALGQAGLAEYHRLAKEAWERLPPVRRRRGEFNYDYERRHLEEILDYFAERAGDVEAQIALRASDLSSPWRVLELAEFCLSRGRADAALSHAEEGLWIFEDDPPDERLVFFAVGLLLKRGRKDDAAAHLWRAFEKTPSMELYERLRKIADSKAGDRAIALLRERKAGRAQWSGSGDLLVEILMRDKKHDEAWETVQAQGASDGLTEKLARATEKTHRPAVLEFYRRRVEALAIAGGDQAYVAAAALVKRIAALEDKTSHAAYVADLKIRFARRRKLIGLLS